MPYTSNRPPNFRVRQLFVFTAIDPSNNSEGIVHLTDPMGQTHMLIDSDESLVRKVFSDPLFEPLRAAYPNLRVLCFEGGTDVTEKYREQS